MKKIDVKVKMITASELDRLNKSEIKRSEHKKLEYLENELAKTEQRLKQLELLESINNN